MKDEKTIRVLEEYAQYLKRGEKSQGTMEKYLRDVSGFLNWLGTQENGFAADGLSVEQIIQWREHLKEAGYAAVTINSMLGAVNSFLRFLGRDDCRAKYLRIQQRLFRIEHRQLSKAEYEILRERAEAEGKHRLSMVMETICGSGIRVSELKYITVGAAQKGRVEIALKGKIRTILLPERLARKLLQYAKKQKIASGEIFLTRNGGSLSRKHIWTEMKALCARAGVAASKVFPHNLRHLFATTFYGMYQDIARLADVLGHSSMETTRIYLMTPEKEHARQLNQMGLVT